jgi:anti-sigma regulatory factor (Ser/Thr protein kinase)
VRIHLPNSAHLANIDAFLRGFDPSNPESLKVSIHERWVSVHPFALALTACLGATCRARGGRVSANAPDHRSVAYLIRMGLFNVLGVDPGRTITEHEASGRFIPLTQIRNAVELKAAIKDLVPLLHAPPAVADPIRYVFSEMARNVLEHAESPVGAFVCAQYYRSSNRIAIGIADAGIGIRQSIGVSHRVTDDASAIRLALQPGVTGTTRRIGGTEFNAGAGLFFTKSIAALGRNIFLLSSGSSAFKLLPGPETRQLKLFADPMGDSHRFLNTPAWQGTAVGIDINVQEGVEFASLLSEIRKAYNIDVKKSRKAYYKKIRFGR